MNKQEWYETFSQLRAMYKSCLFSGHKSEKALDGFWDYVEKVHGQFVYSLQPSLYAGPCYRIADYRWAIRSNSRQFNRKQPRRESKLKWRKP